MTEFKVGDRVRVKDECVEKYFFMDKGSTFIIKSMYSRNCYVKEEGTDISWTLYYNDIEMA